MKYILVLPPFLVPFLASASLYGSADTSVGAGTSGSAGAGASIDASIDVGVGQGATGTATTSTGGDTSVSSDASTQAALDTYVMAQMAEDENVSKVDTSSESRVAVDYKHRGRLFGVFPVTVTSHTTVETDPDATVRVRTSMPWWNLFVSGTGSVSNGVETRLAQSTAIQGNFSAEVSASEKTRLVRAVLSALEAEAQASGSTNVEAN